MSNSNEPLVYNCLRYGDRYEIELDALGEFVVAQRFVNGIGIDPIVYTKFSDIPPVHAHEISSLIWKSRK